MRNFIQEWWWALGTVALIAVWATTPYLQMANKADIIAIQRNQIEQAKVIANKLNSLEKEIKQMKKTMETKPLILPEVRR